MDSQRNDILLVEQIDRLTRPGNGDWMKKQIEQHELRIVSTDATSWQALSDEDPSELTQSPAR